MARTRRNTTTATTTPRELSIDEENRALATKLARSMVFGLRERDLLELDDDPTEMVGDITFEMMSAFFPCLDSYSDGYWGLRDTFIEDAANAVSSAIDAYRAQVEQSRRDDAEFEAAMLASRLARI
jgi:hypothetical protein